MEKDNSYRQVNEFSPVQLSAQTQVLEVNDISVEKSGVEIPISISKEPKFLDKEVQAGNASDYELLSENQKLKEEIIQLRKTIKNQGEFIGVLDKKLCQMEDLEKQVQTSDEILFSLMKLIK